VGAAYGATGASVEGRLARRDQSMWRMVEEPWRVAAAGRGSMDGRQRWRWRRKLLAYSHRKENSRLSPACQRLA